MRRTVVTRRSGGTGTRRTVGGGGEALVSLDNRPLAVTPSRDGKRVLVTLPYEVLILDARDLSTQRSIELGHERPALAEDLEGLLWIGGPHLHRASSWGGSASKIGSKLGGHVARVALLRPGLLAGVGSHGEVLWDVEQEKPAHQRKSPERKVHALVATPDELAVFADGSPSSWVVDPNHASGYSQLRFKHTSPEEVFEEGIVALGVTAKGRCVLGARDGGVAWTHADLRIAHERFPKIDASASYPLEIVGDDKWVYVLRGRGLLQRFAIDPPTADKKESRGRKGPGPGSGSAKAIDEDPPQPLAQSCRLERIAECMALMPPDADGKVSLLFGGPHGDGQLGRLWQTDPHGLAWEDLELGERALAEVSPPEEASPTAPDFTATKHKLKGPPIKQVKVDDVLAGKTPYWLTHGQGNLLERPVAAAEQPLPGDALLIPAMLRMREGTARPGLLVWPGTARDHAQVPRPIWLTWGDEPTGWMRLETPQIREQRWSRADIFPMQIAIKGSVLEAPGRRAPLPKRWFDDAMFASLATECKKALKVLW